MSIILLFFEAALLASALSVDCFVSGFAYGSKGIRIPLVSMIIINLICSGILGVSLFIGSIISPYLPGWMTVLICFSILFVLGIIKLFDSIVKSIIRKHSGLNKQLSFSFLNLNFVLSLYADPETADTDRSLTLSPSEAVSLAIALSLDGIAVGFGAALGNVNGFAVIFCSLITNFFFLLLGTTIGHKIAKAIKFNISWLSGAILIVLAFLKLV